MESVRGKIFLIYLVFTIGILGLAGFSYYSSKKLTEKIEQLTAPNKKSFYIKEINSNLTKFTNLYFESSANSFYSKDHDDIIQLIKQNISLLRQEYDPSEEETLEALDSIPEILDSIAKAHKEIRYLNRQYQDDFYQRVEEEILKKITINDLKDAGYVEEKVKSEIIKIIEKDEAIKENIKQQENEPTILEKMFGLNEKIPKKINSNSDSTNPKINDKINKVKKEALLSSDIDDLFFSKKIDYIKNEVNKVLYQEQIKAIKIREKERQIFNSNVALINKLESIFRKIRREEDIKLRDTTISTYNASKKFNNILIFIISGFGISSLSILFFLFKDIEKNRYYQILLKESEKRANRKALEKQKFLTTMSHELRTPLTSILGFAELMEDQNQYKNAIYSSSKYLLNLVNEIFDLAKLEEGKIEIKEESVNLTNILNELKLSFQELIERSGLEAKFNLPEKDCLVSVDVFRVKQILFNLIHNAIKFTKAGYIEFQAEYKSMDERTTEIILSIKDTGVGIPKEDHERIFIENQQSGNELDKTKGLGIGLGLVKKIVIAMGGNIEVISQEGLGSEFLVNLKLHGSTSDSLIEYEPSQPTKPKKDIDLENIHILTLDDDYFISKLYFDILTSQGAIVHSEENPRTAIQRINSSETISLLITDIKMPGMDGSDVAKEIHEKYSGRIKIIGITANIYFEEEYRESLHFFDSIILKPFTKEEFISKITTVLKEDSKNIQPVQESNNIPISSEELLPPQNFNFNFDRLRKLSMFDEELFRENLSLLYEQNVKDLNKLSELIEKEKFQETAELIHKLSGRISQITDDLSMDSLSIERKLRSEEKNSIEESRILHSYWLDLNYKLESIIQKYEFVQLKKIGSGNQS